MLPCIGAPSEAVAQPHGHSILLPPADACPPLPCHPPARSSHSAQPALQIELIGEEQMAPLFAELAPAVAAHHERCMNPAHPSQRGTAQGPDVYMQAMEAANPFHAAMPGIVQAAMDRVAAATGRRYRLFDYVGHPEVNGCVGGGPQPLASAPAMHCPSCKDACCRRCLCRDLELGMGQALG